MLPITRSHSSSHITYAFRDMRNARANGPSCRRHSSSMELEHCLPLQIESIRSIFIIHGQKTITLRSACLRVLRSTTPTLHHLLVVGRLLSTSQVLRSLPTARLSFTNEVSSLAEVT